MNLKTLGKKKIGVIVLICFICIGAIIIIGKNIDLFKSNNKDSAVQTNAAKEEEAFESILKEKVIPITTVEAENGFDDLNKLIETLKDKKIIAMGEATMGSKEFFEMKHRMFEFLVKEMDFRLFAIGTDNGKAQVVNDYILNGDGSAKEAVKSLLYWTLNTKELEEMVQWMRDFNKNPENKRKIKFYGMDMQEVEVNKIKVLEYLEKVDDILVEEFNQAFKEVYNDINNLEIADESELYNVRSKLTKLIRIFEENTEQYISNSSKSEYELKFHDLKVMQQNLESIIAYKFYKGMVDEGVNVRDYYMAENVKWILEYEKQFGNDKIMLWAHNASVSKTLSGFTPMGNHLSNTFGDEYYSVGFDFYNGSFRARKYNRSDKVPEEFTIRKSYKGTLANSLNNLELPMFFMDFKSVSEDKVIEEYLSKPQPIHFVGIIYHELKRSLQKQVLIDAYDGLIFIKETSATVGLD